MIYVKLRGIIIFKAYNMTWEHCFRLIGCAEQL